MMGCITLAALCIIHDLCCSQLRPCCRSRSEESGSFGSTDVTLANVSASPIRQVLLYFCCQLCSRHSKCSEWRRWLVEWVEHVGVAVSQCCRCKCKWWGYCTRSQCSSATAGFREAEMTEWPAKYHLNRCKWSLLLTGIYCNYSNWNNWSLFYLFCASVLTSLCRQCFSGAQCSDFWQLSFQEQISGFYGRHPLLKLLGLILISGHSYFTLNFTLTGVDPCLSFVNPTDYWWTRVEDAPMYTV